MNKHQSQTWNLLIILLVVFLFLGVWSDWFELLIGKITTYRQLSLNFNPFSGQRTQGVLPSQPTSSGTSQGLGNTRTFTVPLEGGGEMHVNAHDMAGAIDNVIAQGGVPATA